MPARLRDIIGALKHFGVEVEEPSSGSHFKAKRDGSRVYTIPAHNGRKTEISDIYIRALCAHFGIDLAEFEKLL
jgi:predicted RNA binding protein YcfA (HicA-like mRNA interferase family)